MNKYINEFRQIHVQIQSLFWGVALLGGWLGSVFAPTEVLTYYSVALVAIGVASYFVSQAHFALSTILFMASYWILNVYMLHSYAHALFVGILAIQIPIISHLTKNRVGAFVAIITSLAVANATLDDKLTHLALVWMLWCVGYILSRGFVNALEMSLNYQRYILIQMDEARQHRADLASLTKSLMEAQQRLYHLNGQLRYARDLADEARRLKAQFASNVSHELRTPINLIVGFSEVMATTPEAYNVALPSDYRPDVLAIYRNARHLQSLINDILDISQVEAEHLAIIKEYCSLSTILHESVRLTRGLVEERGVKLTTDIPRKLPHVWVDRTRIRQVMLNLVANAVRFTDQGCVTIRACVIEEGAVRIDVQDTGIGISQDHLLRVFDEFYQIPDRNGRTSGTGLGLTLSKKLVQQHGGRMWVESTGIPGDGSIFSFTLPISDNLTGLSTPELPYRKSMEVRQRVFVIDRDPAVRHLFKRYTRNCEVIELHHFDECLGIISKLHPAAIISQSDVVSPHIEKTIEAISPQTALVVCDLPSGKRAMQEMGVSDYLVKPISREGILSALNNLDVSIIDILIVDDDPDFVRMIRRMLHTPNHKYAIRHAYGGREGLAKMRAQCPDVVVLDIMMPDADGFSVIEMMKADPILVDVPIIVVSAKGSSEAIVPRLDGAIRINRGCGFQTIELVNSLDAFVSQLKPHFDQGSRERPID